MYVYDQNLEVERLLLELRKDLIRLERQAVVISITEKVELALWQVVYHLDRLYVYSCGSQHFTITEYQLFEDQVFLFLIEWQYNFSDFSQ